MSGKNGRPLQPERRRKRGIKCEEHTIRKPIRPTPARTSPMSYVVVVLDVGRLWRGFGISQEVGYLC